MKKLRYLRGSSSARAAGGLNNTVRSIRATYETDADVYNALLPKPLEAISRPEVWLQMAHVAMHYTAERTVEIGALTVGLNCTYNGVPGAYCFHMAMEGESVVTSGRERFGEPKKIAATTFVKDGNKIRATCSRHGITYFTIEGEIGEQNANPKQFVEHLYCYKALQGITDPATFDGDVYLTRLNWERNYKSRADMKGQIFLAESPYDPLIDLPIKEILGMEYVEGTTVTGGQILTTVPGEWIAHQWVGRFDDPQNEGVIIGNAGS